MTEATRPYDTDYDSVMERIENEERIYRAEYFAAAAAGMFADGFHQMRIDGPGAFCGHCGMYVAFMVDERGEELLPPE